MAAVTVDAVSKTATLTAGAADTVTVTAKFRRIDITNLDASGYLSITYQSAAATVDGDNTRPVPPGTTRTVADDIEETDAVTIEDADVVISVISSTACKYCVEIY